MDAEVEEWRDVPGYEGRYQVSSGGSVRSIDRVTSKGRFLRGVVLKQSTHGRERKYLAVTLSPVTLGVHVVVALAFVGPRPFPKHDASHRDNNPRNNTPDNIRWLTRQENIAEQKIHDTVCRNGRTGRPKILDENKVREIRASTESQAALARRFGVSEVHVCRILARRKWPNVQ